MKMIEGKGKRAFLDGDGVILEYLDTVTGHASGLPDPGGNVVVGTEPGSGERSLAITLLLWEVLEQGGLPVIPIARLDERRLRVPRADLIPLEVIVRNRATGSFVRRYRRFVAEGAPLGGLVEFTLKDDRLGDPLIVEDAVQVLGLASPGEIAEMRQLAGRANAVLSEAFLGTGVEVWDFKLEFARYRGRLVVRDEFSPRTMRFRTRHGNPIPDGRILDTLRSPSPKAELVVKAE